MAINPTPEMNAEIVHEICTCGRYKLKPHCPTCGSYQIQAFSRRETVNRGHQHIEHIRAYRCRVCSLIFNDDDRKGCKALPANVNGRMTKEITRRKPSTVAGRRAPVVFKSLDELPEAVRERMDEIKKLKDEGKW